MNPHIINLLMKGYEEKRKIRMQEQDIMNWYLGQYFASALDCTVCNSTLWRGKRSEPHRYLEKPILQMENKGEKLTEKEIQREVDMFFARENARRINWKRNKAKIEAENRNIEGARTT